MAALQCRAQSRVLQPAAKNGFNHQVLITHFKADPERSLVDNAIAQNVADCVADAVSGRSVLIQPGEINRCLPQTA